VRPSCPLLYLQTFVKQPSFSTHTCLWATWPIIRPLSISIISEPLLKRAKKWLGEKPFPKKSSVISFCRFESTTKTWIRVAWFFIRFWKKGWKACRWKMLFWKSITGATNMLYINLPTVARVRPWRHWKQLTDAVAKNRHLLLPLSEASEFPLVRFTLRAGLTLTTITLGLKLGPTENGGSWALANRKLFWI